MRLRRLIRAWQRKCAEEAAGASCGVQFGLASPKSAASWDTPRALHDVVAGLFFSSMAPPPDRAVVDSDPLGSSGLPSRTGAGILADPSCATRAVENDRFTHGVLDRYASAVSKDVSQARKEVIYGTDEDNRRGRHSRRSGMMPTGTEEGIFAVFCSQSRTEGERRQQRDESIYRTVR
jgi:hypothetical protein